MVKPRSDSPTARKLVRSFLDFLNSVELSSDADTESLEVAKDCLETAFKLNSVSDEPLRPGLLYDLFSTYDINEQFMPRSVRDNGSSSGSAANQNGVSAEDSKDLEVLTRDELFMRMYAALDKINYFKVSNLGEEDSKQIEKATQIFDQAYMNIEGTEGKKICVAELAESFKTKGNKAMQAKQYNEAIEFYNFAIALCERNAVYYCNRAAAYTNMNTNEEAINDCLKSIEMNPHYSKAYSRLGSAYFAQGNYHDALFKGYGKALSLDPDNRNIQENIRVTKLKLEQHAQAQGQNSNSSFSFGASSTSNFMSDIMRDFMTNLGSTCESNSEGQNGHFSETEIRIDGDNIEVNLGDQNEEIRVTDALRSVMQSFSDQMGPDMNINFGPSNRTRQN